MYMGDETKANVVHCLQKDLMERGELEPLSAALSHGANNNKDNEEEEDGKGKESGSVQEILEEFGGGTSLPGVPRVVGATSRASRVFWIVICVVCLAMFFWGVCDILKLYLSYPKKVFGFAVGWYMCLSILPYKKMLLPCDK